MRNAVLLRCYASSEDMVGATHPSQLPLLRSAGGGQGVQGLDGTAEQRLTGEDQGVYIYSRGRLPWRI